MWTKKGKRRHFFIVAFGGRHIFVCLFFCVRRKRIVQQKFLGGISFAEISDAMHR